MIHDHVRDLGLPVWVFEVPDSGGPAHPGGFGVVVTVTLHQMLYPTFRVRLHGGPVVRLERHQFEPCHRAPAAETTP